MLAFKALGAFHDSTVFNLVPFLHTAHRTNFRFFLAKHSAALFRELVHCPSLLSTLPHNYDRLLLQDAFTKNSEQTLTEQSSLFLFILASFSYGQLGPYRAVIEVAFVSFCSRVLLFINSARTEEELRTAMNFAVCVLRCQRCFGVAWMEQDNAFSKALLRHIDAVECNQRGSALHQALLVTSHVELEHEIASKLRPYVDQLRTRRQLRETVRKISFTRDHGLQKEYWNLFTPALIQFLQSSNTKDFYHLCSPLAHLLSNAWRKRFVTTQTIDFVVGLFAARSSEQFADIAIEMQLLSDTSSSVTSARRMLLVRALGAAAPFPCHLGRLLTCLYFLSASRQACTKREISQALRVVGESLSAMMRSAPVTSNAPFWRVYIQQYLRVDVPVMEMVKPVVNGNIPEGLDPSVAVLALQAICPLLPSFQDAYDRLLARCPTHFHSPASVPAILLPHLGNFQARPPKILVNAAISTLVFAIDDDRLPFATRFQRFGSFLGRYGPFIRRLVRFLEQPECSKLRETSYRYIKHMFAELAKKDTSDPDLSSQLSLHACLEVFGTALRQNDEECAALSSDVLQYVRKFLPQIFHSSDVVSPIPNFIYMFRSDTENGRSVHLLTCALEIVLFMWKNGWIEETIQTLHSVLSSNLRVNNPVFHSCVMEYVKVLSDVIVFAQARPGLLSPELCLCVASNVDLVRLLSDEVAQLLKKMSLEPASANESAKGETAAT